MLGADFRLLANSHIRHLIPYQPGKPIEEVERELGIVSAVKLASNENPLGPSPQAVLKAQEAMQKAHFYPDGGCYTLKQTLANYLKLHASQLTIGNGSENILEIIIKTYLTYADSAIISQYAFLTIPLLIKSYGAELVTVPALNFQHDIKNMCKSINDKTRIIFIVNPNNPTGTYNTADELQWLLESVPPHVLIVVDEAYYEYVNKKDYPNTLMLLNNYPNLVIVRTFSKIYGLAGLRVGYAISSIEIADMLNRARLPFNVNSIGAIAAATAILDHNHVEKSIELNNKGMMQLEESLKKMHISSIPSLGNFITLNVNQSALEVYQKLLLLGVIVRPLTAYDMPSYIRVTVGTWEQNERFLNALQKVI